MNFPIVNYAISGLFGYSIGLSSSSIIEILNMIGISKLDTGNEAFQIIFLETSIVYGSFYLLFKKIFSNWSKSQRIVYIGYPSLFGLCTFTFGYFMRNRI